MNLAKKVCAAILVLMLLLCVACGEETVTKPPKKQVVIIKKPAATQTDTEEVDTEEEEEYEDEEEPEDEEADDSSDENDAPVVEKDKRPLYQKPLTSDSYTPEYKQSKIAWNGPTGYKIVYPDGNKTLMLSALQLRDYFKDEAGVTLEVVTDKTAKSAKEILIGNTNRKKTTLTEKEYKVVLSGDQLSFESGYWYGAIKAVDWFTAEKYEKGFATLIDGKYEVQTSMKRENGVYNLVWGDDFDGDTLNPRKWYRYRAMDAYGSLTFRLNFDEMYTNVKEGRLNMLANMVLDPRNKTLQYECPPAVTTRTTMNYQYGYMEILARYPVKAGAWPSWWMVSCKSDSPAWQQLGNMGNIFDTNFGIEVDILEYTNFQFNIHKWGEDAEGNATGVGHSSIGRGQSFYLDPETQSYEYHIYGYEWDDTTLKVFVDGEEANSFNHTASFDTNSDMEDFKNPAYPLFTHHLIPDAVPTDKSSFPLEFKVEYMRLYQKPGEGDFWVCQE